MYRCGNCNKVVKAKVPQTKVVDETRPKKYKDGSRGWEIVKEISLGPCCTSN